MTTTKKDLWKARMLEFFHQYFIGISQITCSEPFCPLKENWNEIEKKQTKKGKAGLYLISNKDKQWMPVDIIAYEENDLGEYDNVEIQFKSGKQMRMKPWDYKEPKDPEQREIFLKPEELLFFLTIPLKDLTWRKPRRFI